MASAGAGAYKGGPGAEPLSGVHCPGVGAPGGEAMGEKPPEADSILVLEHMFLRSPEIKSEIWLGQLISICLKTILPNFIPIQFEMTEPYVLTATPRFHLKCIRQADVVG